MSDDESSTSQGSNPKATVPVAPVIADAGREALDNVSSNVSSTRPIDPGTSASAAAPAQKTVRASVSDSALINAEEEPWSFWNLLKWCPASKKILSDSENNILSCLKTPFTREFVNIGPVVGTEDCKIWTIRMGLGEASNSDQIPVLFLHGFASGQALWVLNYDAVAAARPVYGIDLLGFGQSSRPKFSTDAKEAEDQFVNSIEAWRYVMNIPKFILVGHSLGGYLATSYAIRYPEPVQHLILADPWGFGEEPLTIKSTAHIPSYVLRFLKICENEPFNFERLWPLRLPGRMGPKCLQLFRTDLIKHFSETVPDAKNNIANYIFQCNVQTPSGESAFKAMTKSIAWAKHPLHARLHSLPTDLPMTFVNGSKSWVEQLTFEEIIQKRGSPLVYMHLLEGCGHHVYAAKGQEFNEIVRNACNHIKE